MRLKKLLFYSLFNKIRDKRALNAILLESQLFQVSQIEQFSKQINSNSTSVDSMPLKLPNIK